MLQTAFKKALNVVLLQGHRMLVSYDTAPIAKIKPVKLQGHQNVGELRQLSGDVEPVVDIARSPECW